MLKEGKYQERERERLPMNRDVLVHMVGHFDVHVVALTHVDIGPWELPVDRQYLLRVVAEACHVQVLHLHTNTVRFSQSI
jgi:6-phosphofructokinase